MTRTVTEDCRVLIGSLHAAPTIEEAQRAFILDEELRKQQDPEVDVHPCDSLRTIKDSRIVDGQLLMDFLVLIQ